LDSREQIEHEGDEILSHIDRFKRILDWRHTFRPLGLDDVIRV